MGIYTDQDGVQDFTNNLHQPVLGGSSSSPQPVPQLQPIAPPPSYGSEALPQFLDFAPPPANLDVLMPLPNLQIPTSQPLPNLSINPPPAPLTNPPVVNPTTSSISLPDIPTNFSLPILELPRFDDGITPPIAYNQDLTYFEPEGWLNNNDNEVVITITETETITNTTYYERSENGQPEVTNREQLLLQINYDDEVVVFLNRKDNLDDLYGAVYKVQGNWKATSNPYIEPTSFNGEYWIYTDITSPQNSTQEDIHTVDKESKEVPIPWTSETFRSFEPGYSSAFYARDFSFIMVGLPVDILRYLDDNAKTTTNELGTLTRGFDVVDIYRKDKQDTKPKLDITVKVKDKKIIIPKTDTVTKTKTREEKKMLCRFNLQAIAQVVRGILKESLQVITVPVVTCQKDPTENITVPITNYRQITIFAPSAAMAEETILLFEQVAELMREQCTSKVELPENANLEVVPVNVPVFDRCNGELGEYRNETVFCLKGLEQTTFLDFQQKAEIQAQKCRRFKATLSHPDEWTIRPGGHIPQLILIFNETDETGALGNDDYPITIPHYNGVKLTAPPITTYRKGNWTSITRCKDNSRLTINAFDRAEAERVQAILAPLIAPSQRNESVYATTYGERGGARLLQITVKCVEAHYWSEGRKKHEPDWVVRF